MYLSPAPLYHSAPLFYCMSTMRLGGTVIVMEQFDPEDALACIEQYHVTHSQWVPTMFVRMLKLPEDVRDAVRPVVAPGRDPRRRTVSGRSEAQDDRVVGTDHLGVLLRDRRHGRDGHQLRPSGSRTPVRSARRCSRPIHILDEDGQRVPAGEIGVVWFEPDEPARVRVPQGPREDEGRTTATAGRTVGDMGYLDDDGYLYLTDRRTFMIVSGGVNIYPQEAENLLITHPKVFDVAVFGIPDAEMGEKVTRVVQPTTGTTPGPSSNASCSRTAATARALQVPEGRSTSTRAAPPADRQALQAPAARPLLGQQDVAHRLMEPGRACIASGRDGDIFEFGPGLVLRTTRDGRSIEREART